MTRDADGKTCRSATCLDTHLATFEAKRGLTINCSLIWKPSDYAEPPHS